MSSYFVNSFCGRYPNGADFQLHNYGESTTGDYRDSTGMHSGRYGYGYNGVDLSVARGNGGHFSERTPGYSPSNSSSAPSIDPGRYAQSSTTSAPTAKNTSPLPLSSPPPPAPEPLPCASSVSPASDARPGKSSGMGSPSNGPAAAGGNMLLNRDCSVAKAAVVNLDEEKPAGSAPSTPQNLSDNTQPQIYPWMRKLHINHGKVWVILL